MMKAFLSIKSLVERLPYPVGVVTSYVPYSWRLGRAYCRSYDLIRSAERWNPGARLNYVIQRLDVIVQFAQKNIPFYRDLYGRSPIRIQSLRDFECLPIITRKDVREYSQRAHGAFFLNTGGTSGEPLSFYVDRDAWAREWAHMHYIWGKRGYRHTDLMFTLLGKDLPGRFYRYNPVHNEFRLNPYKDAGANIDVVKYLFNKYPVAYFQAYPSSVFNFLKEIECGASEELGDMIKAKIRCCFLSSEYPLPYMTDYLQRDWGLDYLSWYGHSEMCVLAMGGSCEDGYVPLLTYGFAEICNGVLCGTSFNNFDMPLIRYATGDSIEGLQDGCGLLRNFRIKDARVGDFVQDKYGRNISLTGLIFGRHHPLFNVADYVQVYQDRPGRVMVLATLNRQQNVADIDLRSLFDSRNAEFDFTFHTLKKPIRTLAGKLKLRVSDTDFQAVLREAHKAYDL